jgi:Concanavalin A-like lectin/glucanases superfamily
VTDASGLGNHGTISEATWTSQGKFGKALIFDTVNDVVVISDAASLDLMPNAISINTWTHLALTYDGSMLRLYVNG